MSLTEGAGIIGDGINSMKTPISAIDNLSVWQLFVAFLIFDVIAWAIIKIIRGRAMTEAAVSDEENAKIEEMIENAKYDSFAREENDST